MITLKMKHKHQSNYWLAIKFCAVTFLILGCMTVIIIRSHSNIKKQQIKVNTWNYARNGHIAPQSLEFAASNAYTESHQDEKSKLLLSAKLTVVQDDGIKPWQYIFFQHVRKNGGTMICKYLLELNLTNSNCQIHWQGYPVSSEMTNTEYINMINNMKDEIKLHNISAVANEFSGFPLIPNISATDDIFKSLWSDILTITNLRDPLIHDLSEIMHGQIATYDAENNSDTALIQQLSSSTKETNTKGMCFKLFNTRQTSFSISSDDTSIKLLHCLKNNVHLTYNPYTQLFSNQIMWKAKHKYNFDETNHKDLIMNEDIFQSAKQVIESMDVILISEMLNVTFVQLAPFYLIPKCSKLWYTAYIGNIKGNMHLNSIQSEQLERFLVCYKDYFEKHIKVVEPHKYIKNNLNYSRVSNDVKLAIYNYTKWDSKLYQFAKTLAVNRSNKILAGRMWSTDT